MGSGTVFLISLVIRFFSILAIGICGMICWNWYMPEIFPSIPHLGFATALGLAFLLAILKPTPTQFDFTDDSGRMELNGVLNALCSDVGNPILVLFYAWIVHWLAFG